MQHKLIINKSYNNVMECMRTSALLVANLYHKQNKNTKECVVGWNKYVKPHYDLSRHYFLQWKENNCPKSGQIYNEYVIHRSEFKRVLRHVRTNENAIKREILAEKYNNNDCKSFWKEVKKLNCNNVNLPNSMDNVKGEKNIVNFWKEHYHSIFNLLELALSSCNDKYLPEATDDISFSPITYQDVSKGIKDLKSNKSCGFDSIYAEHFKNTSEKTLLILSTLFN